MEIHESFIFDELFLRVPVKEGEGANPPPMFGIGQGLGFDVIKDKKCSEGVNSDSLRQKIFSKLCLLLVTAVVIVEF